MKLDQLLTLNLLLASVVVCSTLFMQYKQTRTKGDFFGRNILLLSAAIIRSFF